MTKNQIDALRLQEETRAHKEEESYRRAKLPADYLAGAGRFVSAFTKFKGGKR